MFYIGNFRPQPKPGDVRLVGGSFPSHGFLEVFHNESWRKPCTNGFGNSAAAAVCTQLGYTGVYSFQKAQWVYMTTAHYECFKFLLVVWAPPYVYFLHSHRWLLLFSLTRGESQSMPGLSWKNCSSSTTCASSCIAISKEKCSDDHSIEIICCESLLHICLRL